jgi:hypothetical protein
MVIRTSRSLRTDIPLYARLFLVGLAQIFLLAVFETWRHAAGHDNVVGVFAAGFHEGRQLRHVAKQNCDSLQQTSLLEEFTHPEMPILSNAEQCNRNYAQAINFVGSPSSHKNLSVSCPVLPHVALMQGKRPASSTLESPEMFQIQDCEFRWFSPEQACNLVASVGALYFDGDSLIRQLMVGMGAVLDGNFRSGGIARSIPSKFLRSCQCEKQWQCYQEPANHRFGPDEPQFNLCPNWTRNHIVTIPIKEYLAKNKESNNQLIVIGNGAALHKKLDFTVIQKAMEERLEQSRSTGGIYIPMTVHWPGPNKPIIYSLNQGEEQVENYNNELRDWADEQGIWPLNTYEFTKGLWCRDGVHYDDDNIVMAQLLLNQLQQMQERGIISVVPEANPHDPSIFPRGDPRDVGIIQSYIGSIPRPYKPLGAPIADKTTQ